MRRAFVILGAVGFAAGIFWWTRPPTRVACVGDSITLGSGLDDPDADAYPAQLQRLLGRRYLVRNFGVRGATALAKADVPYVGTEAYRDALTFRPDVVVVMLGANDSKRAIAGVENSSDNWLRKDEFVGDYRALLAAFRDANPAARLSAATPVPVYTPGVAGIDRDAVRDEVVPRVREAARAEGAAIVELFAPLSDHGEWFPDSVHPNEAGARRIAEVVRDAIR